MFLLLTWKDILPSTKDDSVFLDHFFGNSHSRGRVDERNGLTKAEVGQVAFVLDQIPTLEIDENGKINNNDNVNGSTSRHLQRWQERMKFPCH